MGPQVEKLCIRNFPESFLESDIKDFLSRFGISSVECLKRRNKISAIVYSSDAALTKCLIARLHQLKILDRRLIVEYYDSPSEVEIVDAESEVQSKGNLIDSTRKLSKFVEALHAVHPVDFDQPPLPYLRYRYPRPTREIIDSICVALESVPKFYTQVLHLMNRMNLPPPFMTRDIQRNDSVVEKKNASQQTEPVQIKQSLLADDESELESDEDVPKAGPIKRNQGLETNRFKPYNLPQIINAPKSDLNQLKFSNQQPKALQNNKHIILRIPEEFKATKKSPNNSPEIIPTPPPANHSTTATEIDPLANRIPPEQLAELPVFKNYYPGEPSNKLYLKNLAKTVSEDDLKRIFHRFAITGDPDREIDIKLMQTGRMKGQAFITFSYIYEEDLDKLKERPIARALRLTNGLLLKDKPMVVVYGKNNVCAKSERGEQAS